MDVVDRFCKRKSAKGGGICRFHYDRHYRDEVVVLDDGTVRYNFHGTPIAVLNGNVLKLDDWGYATPTTRDRLAAIASAMTRGVWTVSIMFGRTILHNGDFTVNYSLPVAIDVNDMRVIMGERIYIVRRVGRKRINNFGWYMTMKVDGNWFALIDGKLHILKKVSKFDGDKLYLFRPVNHDEYVPCQIKAIHECLS